MAEVPSKVFDRLAKLIRHEASAREIGSIAEANAFAEKIQSTLDEYHIALGDVPLSERPIDPIVRETADGVPHYERRVAWLESLAHGCAYGNDCRFLVHSYSSIITFVGHKADTEVAKYLYSSLAQTALRLVKEELRQARREKRAGTGFSQAFLQGFASTVANRLIQRHRTQEVAHNSATTSLMVVRRGAVEQYMKENITGTARGIGGRCQNWGGHTAGHRAGQNVAIPAGGIGGGTQRRIGG